MYKRFSLELICIFSSLLVFCSCKKDPVNAGHTPTEPVHTGTGIAIGTAVTKSIGPAGGELISGDGKLKIILPENSVDANTEFSIQPITNTLFEGDDSRLAYRLLPEGSTFSKPVQLQFNYDEDNLTNTLEDLLTVAWQQPNGTWKTMPASLNKATKTIAVETLHFSDWTVTGGFELNTEKESLRPDEQSKLWVVSISDDELLASLSISKEDEASLTRLGNWKIIEGSGSLVENKTGSKGFASTAQYTAPSRVNGPLNVVITMELEGFNRIKDPTAPGGIRQTGRMILFGHLIVSENFLTGTLDGVPFGFFGNNVVATEMTGLIAIRASDASGEVTVSVNGNAAGSYPSGQIIFPGKAGVNIGPTDGSPFYTHSYFECGEMGDLKFSPSAVEISKWPAVGQAAEGRFSGPVYLSDGVCGARIKQLELQFNVTRSH
jgi:hypothetical protein